MEWIQDSSDQKVHHKKVREGLFSANNALWKTVNLKHSVLPPVPDADYIAFNDLGKPSHHAMAYAAESSELRYNHPLHIMVSSLAKFLKSGPKTWGIFLNSPLDITWIKAKIRNMYTVITKSCVSLFSAVILKFA